MFRGTGFFPGHGEDLQSQVIRCHSKFYFIHDSKKTQIARQIPKSLVDPQIPNDLGKIPKQWERW